MIFNKTGVKLTSCSPSRICHQTAHTWTHRLTCRLTCRLGARAHTRYAAPYLLEPVWFPLPRRADRHCLGRCTWASSHSSPPPSSVRSSCVWGRVDSSKPLLLPSYWAVQGLRRGGMGCGGWVAASHGFAAELAGSLAGHRVFISGIKTWSIARAAVESAESLRRMWRCWSGPVSAHRRTDSL